MLGLDQGLIKGQRGVVAWVNFNGTGTVAIRASYNVSSITDNGVGDYTVNFASTMPDSNYAVALTAFQGSPGLSGIREVGTAPSVSGFNMRIGTTSNADLEWVMLTVSR